MDVSELSFEALRTYYQEREQLKLKELRSVQLDILKKFINFCEKEKLTYYAIFGTLLGAVRHGGFIPWDDDIDVALPRSDYDKLRKMANKFETPYFLQTPENSPNTPKSYFSLKRGDTTYIPDINRCFAGNFGIGIDIFPLDSFTCEAAATYAISRARSLFGYIVHRSPYDRIPYETLFAEYDNICTEQHALPGTTLAIPVAGNKQTIMEKSWLSERIYLPFSIMTNVNGVKRFLGLRLCRHMNSPSFLMKATV